MDCVTFNTTGMWEDTYCKWFGKHYICQYGEETASPSSGNTAAPATSAPAVTQAPTQAPVAPGGGAPAAPVNPGVDPCPAGVPQDNYLQRHNGACYQFVLYKKGLFPQAKDDCASHGGTLAMVKSAETNEFIKNQLTQLSNPSPVWIGLHDEDEEGKFIWMDGSQPQYTNWAPGKGVAIAGWGQTTMDCTTINNQGVWEDKQCKWFPINYICQYGTEYAAGAATRPAPAVMMPAATAPATAPPPPTPAPTQHIDPCLGLSSCPCPAGMPRDKYVQVHSGACYQFNMNKKLYDEAEKQCQMHQGTLVKIQTQATNDYITDQLNNYGSNLDAWIGLSDLKTRQQFKWGDDSDPTYTNWLVGGSHGKSYQSSCVILYPGQQGAWKDEACYNYPKNFVCQYGDERLPPTTLPPPTMTPAAGSVDICPAGVPRDQFLQVYDGVCYQFMLTGQAFFPDAEFYCESHGGYLAMPKTADINDFLRNQLNRYKQAISVYGQESEEIWIGLTDEQQESTWVWVDGSASTFTNWARGHGFYPSSDDCVVMDNQRGMWQDRQCQDTEAKQFVCQYTPAAAATTMMPAPTTTTTPPPTAAPTTAARCKQIEGIDGFLMCAKTTAPAPAGTTHLCPAFSCHLDCGLDGYAVDVNNCKICKCAN